ncbi:MAG TPA: hypothetical protein PK002_10855 [Cellvibrio sp.]|nr:hypothetical protein [Cellvibrio sp.]
MKNSILPVIFSTVFLTACGYSISSTASTSSSSGTASSPLNGVWFRDCAMENPGEPDTLYDTVRLTFEGDKVSSNIKVYEDSKCLTPFVHAPNPTASGKFVIGKTFTSSTGEVVTEINIQINRHNGAPFDVKTYDIFYLNGNKLYLSSEGAEEPRTRPDTLDFDRVYRKE